MTYLITFTCYGCHLHGSDDGSVDRAHRAHGTPILEGSSARESVARLQMLQPPYLLDEARRNAVLQATQEVCATKGWRLLAAHVRTTYIHVVVEAEESPELVMVVLKRYSSRRLNELDLDPPDRKRWTRHGSTRWLWKPQHVSAALQYVTADQGLPLKLVDAETAH